MLANTVGTTPYALPLTFNVWDKGSAGFSMLRLRSKESGAALVFALVMLVMLTLLALTAVTTSSLQEKMAGNMRDQYMAQQAGDSIVFDGQGLVFNQDLKPTPSCPPVVSAAENIWDSNCLPANVAVFTSLATGPNWWLNANDSWWTTFGISSNLPNNFTYQEPLYVVELVQEASPTAEIGHTKKQTRYYYRTTGWSVGATDYTRGLIQDVFSRRSDTYQ